MTVSRRPVRPAASDAAARRRAQRRIARELREGRYERSQAAQRAERYVELRARRELHMRVLIRLPDGGLHVAEATDLTQAERSAIGKHWSLVQRYLAADRFPGESSAHFQRRIDSYRRKLAAYEGRKVGRTSDMVFAGDPDDIASHLTEFPEDARFETVYVLKAA
jgi:hypothetical protein